MSLAESDAVENNSLDIPNILADFFLKKINMPNYSDDSDYKHRGKKKKSKHKKKKHKKSKHRHASNSSISSRGSTSNDKNLIDDVSSSEEMGMKRLKKIKDKLNCANKSAQLQNFSSAYNQTELVNKDIASNSSTNTNLVYYGPSLELLLSGVDSNHTSQKSEIIPDEFNNSTQKESVDLKSESKVEKSERKDKVISSEIKNTLKSAPIQSTYSTDSLKDPDNCNNEDNVSGNIDKISVICHSDNLSSSATQVIQETSNQNDNISDSKNMNTTKEVVNNSLNKSDFRKESKRTKHSRSRSRSNSKSRSSSISYKNTTKYKHRKRSRSRSRSSCRDSYKTSRDKRRRYSRSRSRSRDKSKPSKRSVSRSHSRSRSRSRYSKYRRNLKSRSRSRSRHRRYSGSSRSREHLSRSRNRSKSYRHSSHSRSRSKSKTKTSGLSKEMTHSPSRSRSKSKERKSISQKNSKIDQAKVLETAKMNIRNMIKSGTLPEGLSTDILKKEQLISIQAGGKSVQELTEYCISLSKKENEPDKSDEEKDDDKPDDETGFIHHPFKVKESATIKLNIKNAVQLPIKTHAQKVAETARLSSQFPVSSGNEHRQKQLEWIPVVPEKPKPVPEPENKKKPTPATNNAPVTNNAIVPAAPVVSTPVVPVSFPCSSSSEIPPSSVQTSTAPLLQTPMLTPPPLPPALPAMVHQSAPLLPIPNQNFMLAYPPPNQHQMVHTPPLPTPLPAPALKVYKPPKKLDISSIVAKRFQALTKLQHSPNDLEALRTIQEAQESIQEWVQSQQVPGLFTGSTDARVLTAAELCGPKYYNFRKDILTHAPPVTEGKGMSLLKKMGWNPGEGLGKNKEGSLEPLVLDIKMDKKGLVSEGENSRKVNNSFMKELQGKHPVSALMELCSKRKWKPPLYTCIMDHGPSHKKVFLFKVEVNGVEYQPINPCSNKKVAKADSAIICLQALNVFPKES